MGGERGAAAARSAGSHGLERWRRFGGCRGRYRFSAGDEVVTSGQLKLQPGAAIKIDNSQMLKPPAELPKQ